MSLTYTTNLALVKPGQGTESGTWGTTVNASLTDMVDQALGYQAFSATGGTDALTIPDGTTGVARSLYIKLTGTGGGTVTVPVTKAKVYFFWNATASGSVTIKVASATNTIVLPNAARIALFSDGSEIYVAENYFTALTLGAALPVASGGTGLTAGTSGGILAYTATGTLASSAALTQYGVVYGGGAGAVPVATANGTTGQIFTATTGGAPSWATNTAASTGKAIAMAMIFGF